MYLKSLSLKKKIALVTGAGKGIGRASAIALAEAGADLIILSRTEKDLIRVKKEINKLKRKCEFYVCDLFNFDQITEVFSKINRLDILVNNAGTNIPEFFNKIKKKVASVTQDDLNKIISLERCLNLLSNVCRHPRCPYIFIFD